MTILKKYIEQLKKAEIHVKIARGNLVLTEYDDKGNFITLAHFDDDGVLFTDVLELTIERILAIADWYNRMQEVVI